MLARRTPMLLSRRISGGAAAAGLSSMSALRRAAPQQQQQCGAMTLQRRNYIGQATISNLAVHATQLGGCTQLSTLLYSPLGTAMLIVLAYNVVVICTKHVNYSMEITAKDYVQDQQLYVIMRYGILSCILLGMEVMFVEV